ncbi:MAG: signal peptide peptidase SppA [Candidatus Altiarchaeales archaeon]|nr:signal peptide peptidase SppA [Candidatus Altiarchaeales archaeon]
MTNKMNDSTKIAVTVSVILLFVIIFAATVLVIGSGIDFSDVQTMTGNKIAIVPVKGMITFGGCGGSLLTGSLACASVEQVKSLIEQADNDPSVSAIFLDVNSGGGSVVASRELMRAVKRAEKPTITWIGEVGASGAYYVASASDYVMADADSVTGSIGVITTMYHYYELMDELGVNVTVVKAGNTKDIGSPYRPMSEQERQEFEDMVDGIYVDFVSDVAENRNMSYAYALNLSGGKIYLGKEAVELGLIDEVSGRHEAILRAGEIAGIKGEPRLLERERKKTVWDILFN